MFIEVQRREMGERSFLGPFEGFSQKMGPTEITLCPYLECLTKGHTRHDIFSPFVTIRNKPQKPTPKKSNGTKQSYILQDTLTLVQS